MLGDNTVDTEDSDLEFNKTPGQLGQLGQLGDNGIINIWNATSGRCVNRLIGHRDAVVDVRWSADGQKILTGSSDWKVRMWWPNIHGNVTAKQEEEQEEQREQLVESKKEEEKKENKS